MTSSNTKTKHSIILREKFRATRPLDYIYDPLYTFSGPKDYYKTAYESFKSSSEFSVQPIFESMFSDMLRYPRASLLLKSSHQLPSYIDTSYNGKLRAIDEQSTSKADVIGADRFKFFKRPTTEASSFAQPVISRFPMLGIENITKLGTLAPPATAYISSSPPKLESVSQTKAIQTDFREVETQTRPWTPPYITEDSDSLEILTLETLRWGKELPANIHTVEIIEHLRMKRAWENTLPPVDSLKNLNRRRRMIADLEKATWQFRDEEIQYTHNMRLKQLEENLKNYKKIKAEILEEKIKWLSEERFKEKNRKINLISHRKARALRKLAMKERGYNPKYHKMNITNELDDYTSQVYAPFQYWGTNYRNRHEVITSTDGVKIDYNDQQTYLLSNIKPQQAKFDVNKASQPKKQIDLCFRETRWTEENLDKLHADLKAIRLKDNMVVEKRPFKMRERIPKPPKPKEIASVEEVSDYERRVYNAAVILQKVIKGRALQVELFKERNRWHELIEELKQIYSVEGLKTDLEKPNNIILKLILEDRRKHIKEVCQPQEVDPTMMQDIGEAVNFLSTEHIRIKEEKEVHDLILNLEYERWRREVAESGHRQKEIQRRKEHEEIYNKVDDTHEKTANLLLNSVCKEGKTAAAEVEAEEFVQEFGDDIDAAYLRNDDLEKEVMLTELLYNFVLPESNKALMRQRMNERNQKNLLAIHNQIFGSFNNDKLEEIPKVAVDFVDNIISEAVSKLCYTVAEDIVQSIWEKAQAVIEDNAVKDDYVVEELMTAVWKEFEPHEDFESQNSDILKSETEDPTCNSFVNELKSDENT